MAVRIKTDIRRWLQELDKKYFLVMLGFSAFVFFPLIALRLTNTVDGLWTTTEYMAGTWELSNGRWFWLVTSFLRFSLQLEPINAAGSFQRRGWRLPLPDPSGHCGSHAQ